VDITSTQRISREKNSTYSHMLEVITLPAAAIGYSLLYLLFGGGFVGAVIIFIVAKMFRK
jgi:hypothetical protein